MPEFIKKIILKINKLDDFINRYKDNAGEVSMPSFAYVNWGMKLLDKGETDSAIEMFQKSIDMPYTNAEAYINFGVALARTDRYEEALNYFKKATKLDHESAKAYEMLGSVYSELGNSREAENCFTIALRINPRNPQTYINRAIHYAKISKFKESVADFKSACRLNPANAQGWFLWGVLCAQTKDYDEALEKFKRTVSLAPYHNDAYRHLAAITFLNKDYKESVKFAKRAIAINPSNVDSYIALAESWLHLKNEKECFSAYLNAEKKCLTNDKFYYSWGISLQFFKKWAESVEKLNKSLKLNDKEPLTYNALSVGYFKTDREDMAIKMLEKTLEIQPCHTVSLFNLGQYYSRKKEYEKSIEYFKRAIASNVDAKHMYANIAANYECLGETEEALENWKKAVEYNPDNLGAKLNLANAYFRAGDIKTALRKIRGMYKENKKNPKVLLLYGVMLIEEKEYYEAIDKFDEILEIDKNHFFANYSKAECYFALNKVENADEILKELEKNNSDKSEILYLRVLINKNYIENNNRQDLIEQTTELCDKIISKGGSVLHNNVDINKIKEEIIKTKGN